MRKYAPVGAACLVIALCAFGMKQLSVTPVAMDEGDQMVPISKECSSSAWTVIDSSSSIRRNLWLQLGTSNLDVCISTPQASGVACTTNLAGVHLSTSSIVGLKEHRFYTKAALSCRTIGAVTTNQVLGYYSFDRDDIGAINR